MSIPTSLSSSGRPTSVEDIRIYTAEARDAFRRQEAATRLSRFYRERRRRDKERILQTLYSNFDAFLLGSHFIEWREITLARRFCRARQLRVLWIPLRRAVIQLHTAIQHWQDRLLMKSLNALRRQPEVVARYLELQQLPADEETRIIQHMHTWRKRQVFEFLRCRKQCQKCIRLGLDINVSIAMVVNARPEANTNALWADRLAYIRILDAKERLARKLWILYAILRPLLLAWRRVVYLRNLPELQEQRVRELELQRLRPFLIAWILYHRRRPWRLGLWFDRWGTHTAALAYRTAQNAVAVRCAKHGIRRYYFNRWHQDVLAREIRLANTFLSRLYGPLDLTDVSDPSALRSTSWALFFTTTILPEYRLQAVTLRCLKLWRRRAHAETAWKRFIVLESTRFLLLNARRYLRLWAQLALRTQRIAQDGEELELDPELAEGYRIDAFNDLLQVPNVTISCVIATYRYCTVSQLNTVLAYRERSLPLLARLQAMMANKGRPISTQMYEQVLLGATRPALYVYLLWAFLVCFRTAPRTIRSIRARESLFRGASTDEMAPELDALAQRNLAIRYHSFLGATDILYSEIYAKDRVIPPLVRQNIVVFLRNKVETFNQTRTLRRQPIELLLTAFLRRNSGVIVADRLSVASAAFLIQTWLSERICLVEDPAANSLVLARCDQDLELKDLTTSQVITQTSTPTPRKSKQLPILYFRNRFARFLSSGISNLIQPTVRPRSTTISAKTYAQYILRLKILHERQFAISDVADCWLVASLVIAIEREFGAIREYRERVFSNQVAIANSLPRESELLMTTIPSTLPSFERSGIFSLVSQGLLSSPELAMKAVLQYITLQDMRTLLETMSTSTIKPTLATYTCMQAHDDSSDNDDNWLLIDQTLSLFPDEWGFIEDELERLPTPVSALSDQSLGLRQEANDTDAGLTDVLVQPERLLGSSTSIPISPVSSPKKRSQQRSRSKRTRSGKTHKRVSISVAPQQLGPRPPIASNSINTKTSSEVGNRSSDSLTRNTSFRKNVSGPPRPLPSRLPTIAVRQPSAQLNPFMDIICYTSSDKSPSGEVSKHRSSCNLSDQVSDPDIPSLGEPDSIPIVLDSVELELSTSLSELNDEALHELEAPPAHSPTKTFLNMCGTTNHLSSIMQLKDGLTLYQKAMLVDLMTTSSVIYNKQPLEQVGITSATHYQLPSVIDKRMEEAFDAMIVLNSKFLYRLAQPGRLWSIWEGDPFFNAWGCEDGRQAHFNSFYNLLRQVSARKAIMGVGTEIMPANSSDANANAAPSLPGSRPTSPESKDGWSSSQVYQDLVETPILVDATKADSMDLLEPKRNERVRFCSRWESEGDGVKELLSRVASASTTRKEVPASELDHHYTVNEVLQRPVPVMIPQVRPPIARQPPTSSTIDTSTLRPESRVIPTTSSTHPTILSRPSSHYQIYTFPKPPLQEPTRTTRPPSPCVITMDLHTQPVEIPPRPATTISRFVRSGPFSRLGTRGLAHTQRQTIADLKLAGQCYESEEQPQKPLTVAYNRRRPAIPLTAREADLNRRPISTLMKCWPVNFEASPQKNYEPEAPLTTTQVSKTPMDYDPIDVNDLESFLLESSPVIPLRPDNGTHSRARSRGQILLVPESEMLLARLAEDNPFSPPVSPSVESVESLSEYVVVKPCSPSLDAHDDVIFRTLRKSSSPARPNSTVNRPVTEVTEVTETHDETKNLLLRPSSKKDNNLVLELEESDDRSSQAIPFFPREALINSLVPIELSVPEGSQDATQLIHLLHEDIFATETDNPTERTSLPLEEHTISPIEEYDDPSLRPIGTERMTYHNSLIHIADRSNLRRAAISSLLRHRQVTPNPDAVVLSVSSRLA
ncbi:hypothetical protein GMRT_14266 [Giardia muris]|uniref:Uncharacterized protein n=1 Tax=Giardia muris TaxID=5742 RepID=A0A4Z1T7W8_GIAMU|nr:hypothetical protein GMRT_14266 [Giardia muris]|eukprot:TNJ30193.1 hypothetical protein GMRT_14266 [Giardia muris]